MAEGSKRQARKVPEATVARLPIYLRSLLSVASDGIPVRHIDDLPDLAAAHQIAIGIIATPATAAQEVADRMIAAGLTSILNFAPTIVSVPPGVSLRKVDLAVELQILSFYQQRRGARDGAALPPP